MSASQPPYGDFRTVPLPEPKPLQYPAGIAMSPTEAALWLLLQQALARQIANPADPYHWIHHLDPETGAHGVCECEGER